MVPRQSDFPSSKSSSVECVYQEQVRTLAITIIINLTWYVTVIIKSSTVIIKYLIGCRVDNMGFGAYTTIIIIQANRCTIAYPSL